jgi:nucleotide-binding universal stress UspA family protein
MAPAKTYLVPFDFSIGSDVALRHAVELARKEKGKLVLVHVLPLVLPLASVKRTVRREIEAIAASFRLKPEEYRLVVVERPNAARAIARLAKKTGASMIIMGSHGRTGLQRLVLGSVAERTLRFASCPVLIVKK